MPSFRAPIELNKQELRNARVQNLGSAPASPVTGQIYYNSGDNNLYVYDGSGWVDLTVQGTVVSDATTSTKGIVQLAGDLGGTGTTAAAPVITNGAISTAKIADGAVTGGTAGAGVKIAAGTITAANVAAANIDGSAATASLRTLGTGAAQAAAGNDSRFHTQNTDLGTTATSFYLVGTAAADVRLKKSASGELSARLGDDSGYAAFQAGNTTVNGNLTVTGTTTTINSNTFSVGDNIIELNNDVTTTALSTENAGITVRRYTGADVRQDAVILWDESADRWAHTFPASSGTGVVTRTSAVKYVETLGAVTGGTPVSINHNFNTRDVSVSVRDTATNEFVYTDSVASGVDTVQVTFGASAGAGAYTVTVIG